MNSKLQEIPKKILEWWNKFTSKQKTIIVSIAAGVVVALAILATILTRPQYTALAVCESTKEASTIKELLEGEGITPKVSDDGLKIDVLTKDLSKANLTLGKNNIPTLSYDLERVFSGGFSTTEADKQKKYKLYREEQLEADLAGQDYIKSARVTIEMAENDGTLIAKEQEGFVSIILELSDELPQDGGLAIATFAKNAIGNKTANNIVIMDTQGNLLYSGEDNYSVSGSAGNQLGVKQQAENVVKNEVKKVLIGTGQFSKIEVASNLVLDFSNIERISKEYSLPSGQEQGLIVEEDHYASEATGGVNGVPGTDSNTETTYVFQDNEYSSQSTTEDSMTRVVNEMTTSQSIPPGLVKYGDSSLSVTTITYKMLKEEDAKKQGLLDGITWEEYKLANGEKKKLTVDEELYDVVSKATGIAVGDIKIMSYEEPVFVDKEGMAVTPADIVQVVLIVLILGLLAFVVLRSMRSDKSEVEEEEISVENLLQSTPETELKDIGLETKSETRKVIEKFVEDNPEAVASLLRNWLNEDWG